MILDMVPAPLLLGGNNEMTPGVPHALQAGSFSYGRHFSDYLITWSLSIINS